MSLSDDFWAGEREKLYEALFPHIRRAALTGAANAVTELGVGLDMNLINEAAEDWARAYTYDLVTGINGTSRSYLQTTISEWIESGQPLDELIDTITQSGMFGPVRSEMIAVTEVTRSFAEGNITAWRESGVVEGMVWQTGQDDLVCPICAPLAGQSADLDGDGFGEDLPAPPAHIRCRCYLKPKVRLP